MVYWVAAHEPLRADNPKQISVEKARAPIGPAEFVGVTAFELALLALVGCLIYRYVRQRDQAAAALQKAQQRVHFESQARLAAVVESSVDAIISKTLDGVITTWNAGAQSIFGYTADEAIGRPISFLIPVDRQEEEGILKRLHCGERVEAFETVRVTRDGRLIDVSVAVSPIRDADGNVVGASKIARDVTDRKRIERALRESQARTTAIVNAAVDGILTIDGRGIIEFVNPAAISTFGYTEAELIGQNINLLMPEPFVSEHDGYLAKYHKTGERKIIGIGREVEAQRKDGSTFPADLAVSEIPADAPGSLPRFAGILRDVTARKRAEALRVARDAAEAANRAKDDFLAAVSHDLRTPIGSILLLAELLRRKNPTEEQRRKIDAIKEAAQAQSRLIEDILDATRVLHRTLKLDLRPVGLAAVVRAAVEAVEPMAREKGVGIAVEEVDPGGSGLPVRGDELRLQQVFWNLLTNGVKFSQRGTEVRVWMGPDESGIRVRVIDQGEGIAPEFLPHVFDRMSQAPGATAQRQSGLGLGLSIVRHIVELHGGLVRAESDGPRRGATFTVKLPRPKIESAAPPLTSLQDLRVLVVEDVGLICTSSSPPTPPRC